MKIKFSNREQNMSHKPKILITNDDGVHAPGIRQLWSVLKDFADVTVVAPATEQSATGMSITLRRPLQIEKAYWGDEEARSANIWSVNGTPADAVKIGLSCIVNEQPDFVVSGINKGKNSGRNVLYSGTVSATMESVLHDVPGIAFSCFDYHYIDFALATQHVKELINYFLENPIPRGTLINVNFPSAQASFRGFKFTRQGKEYWMEDPHKRIHPAEGTSYYWLGCKLSEYEEEEDCDVTWLKKGYATVVPLQVSDLTHQEFYTSNKTHFENSFKEKTTENAAASQNFLSE